MNALQLWHLKRFCDKHGLDYQLIDDTLTYSENKKNLSSFVIGNTENQIKEWSSREEGYMRGHALAHYIACVLDGETRSEEMGPPLQPRFSLSAYIKSFLG